MKSEELECQWQAVKGQTDMTDFVSPSDQRAMRVLVPPIDVQRGFDHISKPIFEQAALLVGDTRKIAATRDYLLPHLLSGSIRVVDDAFMAEGAMI